MITNLLDIKDILWLSGVSVAGISTLIQGLSKKYKPWSWLAIQIGRAINKEVIDDLNEIKKEVETLKVNTKLKNDEDEKKEALEARRRILRFADECRRKEKHSQEYFNNVLEDISSYKDYCDRNKNFENEKAVMAIAIIDKIYNHAFETNDFL